MADVKLLNMHIAKAFVRKNHYAIESPSSCKLAVGLYDPDLRGVIIYGYGTRPLHTIKALFPSLTVSYYLEINRLCLLDECPRNSESQFIKASISLVRTYMPSAKLVFSWSDGLRGKPGYVYQASNFLYGGYIWSEFYITDDGEVIPPRLLITRYGRRDREFTEGLGLTKIKGYQFRYCKFLCGHRERKRLLDESLVEWSINYPKCDDLKWVIAGEVSREIRQLPILKGSGQFRHPAPKNQGVFFQ